MTDRPIIFSAPMIRALLDGRKTQTRRTLKPQPDMPPVVTTHGVQGTGPVYFSAFWGDDGEIHQRLPHAPGDRLWVREAWRASDYYDDGTPKHLPVHTPIQYEATEPTPNGRSLNGRVRSPIHMPRWASRLTLTVTDVRVQRVQEISDADAVAEGVRSRLPDNGIAKCEFMDLWNSINGLDAWGRNDWVAAYTFTVEKRDIDQ